MSGADSNDPNNVAAADPNDAASDDSDNSVNHSVAAHGVLSAEDRAPLVNARNDNLQLLAVKHVNVIEALSPNVRKRAEFLKSLQREHDKLETKFLEERAQLEAKLQAKYLKLYEPLYTKRYEIVNGVIDVDGITNEAAVGEENAAAEEKGIPSFWLTAMKANETLAEEITESDEKALKYLKDIKWCKLDNPNDFKLEFYFDANPYFQNSVLTQTYQKTENNYPITATVIEWHPEKCLTHKLLKKLPKKGSNSITLKSFFHIFNPPKHPDDIDDNIVKKLHNLR